MIFSNAHYIYVFHEIDSIPENCIIFLKTIKTNYTYRTQITIKIVQFS